ncbi:Protein fam50a [Perkinsus olseni]|uniref:Protein fam50a n=1 Tax=Perkinsus olseni TaxID=32597 RepID=A0A7J6P6X5_PEROL|nr:Protein fam50a [Perkinsus olseni]
MHCARVFWDEWAAEIKAVDDDSKSAVLTMDFTLLRPWIKCVRVCSVKAVVDEIYLSLLLKTPVKEWVPEVRTWMYKIGENTRTEDMQREAAYAAVDKLEKRMKKEVVDLSTMESGNAVLQTIQSCENQRAYKLLKQREASRDMLTKERKDIEHQTEKLAKRAMAPSAATSKLETLEAEFSKQTVGLQSRSDYLAKRKKIDDLLKEEMTGEAHPTEDAPPLHKSEPPVAKKRKSINKVALSFADEDDSSSSEAEDSEGAQKEVLIPKLKKDPNAKTDFLPDAERDATLEHDRQRLVREYYEEQEKQKGLPLKVTYSYFNGTNHRRTIGVTQGCTVTDFLARCKDQLEADFPELKSRNIGGSSWDELLFVKEDVILPGNLTFHALIRDEARSQVNGLPLYQFEVDDGGLGIGDIRVTKNRSNPGKIVDRKWYEENKHVFPANKWEPYDPTKSARKEGAQYEDGGDESPAGSDGNENEDDDDYDISSMHVSTAMGGLGGGETEDAKRSSEGDGKDAQTRAFVNEAEKFRQMADSMTKSMHEKTTDLKEKYPPAHRRDDVCDYARQAVYQCYQDHEDKLDCKGGKDLVDSYKQCAEKAAASRKDH